MVSDILAGAGKIVNLFLEKEEGGLDEREKKDRGKKKKEWMKGQGMRKKWKKRERERG